MKYILHSAVQDEVFPNEYFDNLDIVSDRAIRLAHDCFGVSIHISEYLTDKRIRVDKETPKYKIKEFFAVQNQAGGLTKKVRYFQPYFNKTATGLTNLKQLITRIFPENEIFFQKVLVSKLEENKQKIFEYLIEAYTKPVYLNAEN